MRRSLFLTSAVFFATVLCLSGSALANQISSYSISSDLNKDGTSNVKLDLTFTEPIDTFDATFPFKMTNFTTTTASGTIVCNNNLGAASIVSCSSNGTLGERVLELSFQTPDLIKSIGSGFVFSGDFSLKIPVRDVLVAVRLPEGMGLSQSIPGGATLPYTNSTFTDGRRITMIWRLLNTGQQPLSFQVYYETVVEPAAPGFVVPPLRVLVLLAIIFGGGIGLLFLRRRKKTEEVIFSVLDDYEKRVISSIEKEGGIANQKKIVVDTNLSKAKVSRVVQKLVERGLLSVERRGRTNIVKFLKKKMTS